MERDLAGIPTAFSGTYGQGGPVIGFLGEFDALPGLSQAAGADEKRPVEENGPGHGGTICWGSARWPPPSP